MRILNKLAGVVALFVLLGTNFSDMSCEAAASAGEKKSVVVISDRLEQANPQYFIYPQVSEMVSAEIINELNKEGVVKAPTLSAVREKLRSQSLVRSADKLLHDYRYTYELNYGALKKIAKEFNTTNVLLVTGSLDTVSDFLKPTWWNFLNVPGENVVKSEYRLYTYIALVDLNTETITWQNTYHRQITSPEFALANAQFSPDYRQLTKIKKGSIAIAKDASYRVESVLVPWFVVDKTPPTVHELVKFKVNKKYDECIQNINEKKAAMKAKKEAQNKEVNAVLKTPKSSESLKNEDLEIKINKIEPVPVDTKALPEKDSAALELRPPIEEKDEPKNIQISPLNVIIPKM